MSRLRLKIDTWDDPFGAPMVRGQATNNRFNSCRTLCVRVASASSLQSAKAFLLSDLSCEIEKTRSDWRRFHAVSLVRCPFLSHIRRSRLHGSTVSDSCLVRAHVYRISASSTLPCNASSGVAHNTRAALAAESSSYRWGGQRSVLRVLCIMPALMPTENGGLLYQHISMSGLSSSKVLPPSKPANLCMYTSKAMQVCLAWASRTTSDSDRSWGVDKL